MNTYEQIHTTDCFHCGEHFNRDRFKEDGHEFCCIGCLGAYQVLNDRGLCDYYDIERGQGNTLTSEVDSEAYEYLDNPSIQKKLLDFTDGELSKVTLKLPQIHCSSCIWLLENLNSINMGIAYSRVNFSAKTIHIHFNEHETSLRKVVELLATFGYLPEINLESSNAKPVNNTSKKIYYQLGIAGFCFGNIMLMSFPEYIGLTGDFQKQFTGLFRWMNALLSIPVIFYSASGYLQNALNALRTRILNLDVPIVLGIVALFGRSMYEVLNGIGSGYFDSLVGFVFFLLLGKFFQEKTYRHLSFERDFKSFFPLAIARKSDDGFEPIEITQLRVADIIKVKNGQIIPCDSILLSESALLDYSFVTGESDPIPVKMGELAYAGGKHLGSAVELLVEKPVSDSYLMELWKGKESTGKNGISHLADQVGKYFTYAILIIAAFTFVFWSFTGLEKAFLSFTSVLIVACPCALALSIPFTQGTAMRWLAKHGFFMKDSGLLENMTGLTHLVFDKTGTLTQKEETDIVYRGKSFAPYAAEVKGLVAQSSHPLSQQVFVFLADQQSISTPTDYKEVPSQGITGLFGKNEIKLGSAEFTSNTYAHSGAAQVHLAINGVYYGSFSLSLGFREGLAETTTALSTQYQLTLLSGDNDHQSNTLAPLFGGKEHLRFNQKPLDKQAFIHELQQNGGHVAMIGDGLNDAGALLDSDLGISVTDDENNFTPASDIIIKGNILRDLPNVFKLAKRSQHIIYLAFAISFAYNLVGLSFAVQGLLSPVLSAILMPLSSITVVLFTTIATSLTVKKLHLS